MKRWVVYLLRCKDGTLYTGITNDLAKRIKAHNEGKGAKYTRGRGPVALVGFEKVGSVSRARVREYQIKGLSRIEKERLFR